MGHPRAWLQHDAGNPTQRNVREYRPHPKALLIHHDKSAVHHVDFALLDEDDGHALLDGNGFEGWKHGQVCAGARDSIPRPSALA